MNHLPNTGPHGRRPIPRSGSHDATSSEAGPHPRHPRSLHDRWHITGTEYHHDYEFHLVDDDDPATDDHNPAPDHDDHGPEAGHRESTAGTSSDSLPTGDRRRRTSSLRPIRNGCSRLVRWNRLARIELPTRRRQSNFLSWIEPVGAPASRRLVRSTRSRLADHMDGSRREPCRSCIALRVLGIITLATLIVEAR